MNERLLCPFPYTIHSEQTIFLLSRQADRTSSAPCPPVNLEPYTARVYVYMKERAARSKGYRCSATVLTETNSRHEKPKPCQGHNDSFCAGKAAKTSFHVNIWTGFSRITSAPELWRVIYYSACTEIMDKTHAWVMARILWVMARTPQAKAAMTLFTFFRSTESTSKTHTGMREIDQTP